MLKLEGFNSTIYSFNKKTGVSFTPKPAFTFHIRPDVVVFPCSHFWKALMKLSHGENEKDALNLTFPFTNIQSHLNPGQWWTWDYI